MTDGMPLAFSLAIVAFVWVWWIMGRRCRDPVAIRPCFGDLERAGLGMAVTYQHCDHQAVVDDTSPKLAAP